MDFLTFASLPFARGGAEAEGGGTGVLDFEGFKSDDAAFGVESCLGFLRIDFGVLDDLGGGIGVTVLVDADTLSSCEPFCFVFCRFSCLSSISGADFDELCFDFFSPPSLCFLFSGVELVGAFETLGFGRGGASVISSSDEESDEDEGIDAGFLNPLGASSSSSSSETLSVVLPSTDAESEPIVPGLPVPNPIGKKRIFRPLG